MAIKADSFYTDLLTAQIADAVTNNFGQAILKLPNQGRGSVHEDVDVYFSAIAMEQVNSISEKYGINDPEALHEIFQTTKLNLLQGFRIGQNMRGIYQGS
ncbi:MAG: hypothetical protein J0H83_02430 [Candidatus Melainabacteria bacterium]|jgi:hypothetical protein|nr:hypothetical protein [Candidatus Melainabacteria bacterium]MBX9672345.1 hypothetical protein [Candidatus Obscuribacterales bacterium]